MRTLLQQLQIMSVENTKILYSPSHQDLGEYSLISQSFNIHMVVLVHSMNLNLVQAVNGYIMCAELCISLSLYLEVKLILHMTNRFIPLLRF